jgi:subtilase family serine protease
MKNLPGHRLIPAILLLIATTIGIVGSAAAQSSTVRLAGNHPSVETMATVEATSPLVSSTNLSMRAVLALRNQSDLTQLLQDLQDPSSSEYHRWLTPQEFTVRFGPTPEDIAQVSSWLSQQGFKVTSANASDRTVRFSGSAAQASAAFKVTFAASSDGRLYGNVQSPSISQNISPLIQSIQGLDNLRARAVTPQPDVKVTKFKKAFGPPDMYEFYHETPLLTAGIDGTTSAGDCIALAEYSDFDDGSVDAFNSTFGLPSLTDGVNLNRVAVDGPSFVMADAEVETLLDIEYSHTAAPGAPIMVYIATDESAAFGFLDTVQQAVTDNKCGTISLSIGVCPGDDATLAQDADSIYQQAVAQGQTVFAASGDDGAAGMTVNKKGACVTSRTRALIETAASPNVESVGGTQFTPKYDRTTGIDVGFVPESVWHEAKGAGGGGVSAVFSKPTYQNGLTPNDNFRDIPDISLAAAIMHPGYVLGINGQVECCAGGTSFAAPYWAGIGLVMEQLNGARLGAINPQLYSLMSTNAAGSGIRDVTKGSNGFHGVVGFRAKPGYDQASGWGTPDITTFAHAFTGK